MLRKQQEISMAKKTVAKIEELTKKIIQIKLWKKEQLH